MHQAHPTSARLGVTLKWGFFTHTAEEICAFLPCFANQVQKTWLQPPEPSWRWIGHAMGYPVAAGDGGKPEIQQGSQYGVNSPDPNTRHDSAVNDRATIASPNGAGQANKTDFSDCISKVENVSMTFVPARGEPRTVLFASLLQPFHKGSCSGQGLILQAGVSGS